MKKILITAISTIALMTAASAQTPFLNPYGPSGGTGITAKALSENLNTKGYNYDLKMITNCVLYKQVWDNSSKAVSMRDTTANAGLIEGCDVPTTKENLVMISNLSPIYLCNVGNGKTLEDFRKPGATWTIGDATTFPKFISDKLGKANKNNLKFILYDTTSSVTTAAKAGELDFVWANGNWPETQLNGKCFVTTGTNDVAGMQKATDIWPDISELKLTYAWWIIAKGYTQEELTKLKKDIRTAWETDTTWVELRKKRNFNDNYVNKLTEQQSIEILDRDREIWRKSKQ